MEERIELWKSKPAALKVLSIIIILLSLAVIVLAVLDLVGIKYVDYVYISLLGVILLLQGIISLKTSKMAAIVSFVGSAIMIISVASKLFF